MIEPRILAPLAVPIIILFIFMVGLGFRSAEDVRIDDEIRLTQKSEMKWVDRRLSDLEERIKRLEAMVGGSDDKGRR